MNVGSTGWNTAEIDHLVDTLETDCLLILQGGRTVYSYGDVTHRYLCHSMRKSFLAALMGQDVEAGIIRLDATLEELGIDDNEGLSAVERKALVHDLLTARSGIYHPAGYETEWMKSIKEKRHSHGPGTFWCYNNWDFNALGTIFVRATGQSVAEAFAARIARPLGFQDFDAARDAWTESFVESRHDAYPFRLSSRDLARFGQMFLQGGMWEGRRILPDGWAEENVMPYSHAGTRGAYGYMWWLERDGVFAPGCVTPRGSYAAVGAGGHYCLVVPERDMVIVHRVNTDIKGRTISKHGFGRLLRAIFATSAQPAQQGIIPAQ
ncbi:serine hydrolase domain-containing protein [Falsirhodobacter sp. 1013]|uniref:serine hydrolase domain-containing protein n=1 Tax=Falsirhodobacter sp. 1013 TaxID=3417566 RepID=UPI003EBD2644